MMELSKKSKKRLAQGAVDLAIQMGYLDELRAAVAAVREIAGVPVPSTVRTTDEEEE
jgi:hypothetical protein